MEDETSKQTASGWYGRVSLAGAGTRLQCLTLEPSVRIQQSDFIGCLSREFEKWLRAECWRRFIPCWLHTRLDPLEKSEKSHPPFLADEWPSFCPCRLSFNPCISGRDTVQYAVSPPVSGSGASKGSFRRWPTGEEGTYPVRT